MPLKKKKRPVALLRHTIRHPLTDVTLFGKRTGGKLVIVEVWLGEKASISGGRRYIASPDPGLLYFGKMLYRALDGKAEDLSTLPIDMSAGTQFRKNVLLAARSIPFGTTVSYTGLAKLAGRPKAIRAVASVMRNNRFPLIVPCHRVIKSDGTIGGFMGRRKGRSVELKKMLLERERKTRMKSCIFFNTYT